MAGRRSFINSSIGRKIIMGLTGLFLCIFLIAHLAGNMLLLMGDGGLSFNIYAHFMATNPLVRVIELILVVAIFWHIIEAAIITIKNNRARKIGYEVSNASANSTWFSRNMGIFGLFILIFLVIHIANFFVAARLGELPPDVNGNKDLYTVVFESFSNVWYVLFYVVSMAFLGFHLAHGVYSSFRTVGVSHKKYVPTLKFIAYFFAIVIPILYAVIPIYFYLIANN